VRAATANDAVSCGWINTSASPMLGARMTTTGNRGLLAGPWCVGRPGT
jgi:hypothetical protein